jgi:ABC-type transport system involved in cytochrome c biogenesis permease subunit
MPLLWLRISVALYGVGLLYALMALSRRGQALSRFALPAMTLGMVLQFVSLVETARLEGHLAPATVHDSEALLAFVLMVFFLAVYARYRTLTPGIFVFPLVFLLTFAAAIGKEPPQFSSPLLRNGWIVAHITLIFAGYAALFVSLAASLLYLLQERGLKSKQSGGIVSRLPALEVIDDIGYKSLLLGFPFMTLGLIFGSAIAGAEFGAGFFSDPKILLSLLMWAVYMVLLYTRWSAGWRGRRAAFMSTIAFLAAVGAWAANFFSGVHRFTSP